MEFAGERYVGGPAEICRTTRCYESGGRDQAAEEIEPVAEGVESRETHVRRPDLQWHEVVGESEEHRGRVQQEHDRAVHGEQLVVLLVGQDCIPGTVNSMRMSSAISPPIKKKANDVTMYIRPIIL